MGRVANAKPVKVCRFTQSNRVMPGYVTPLLPHHPPDGRTEYQAGDEQRDNGE